MRSLGAAVLGSLKGAVIVGLIFAAVAEFMALALNGVTDCVLYLRDATDETCGHAIVYWLSFGLNLVPSAFVCGAVLGALMCGGKR